jgi:hypothetical protein
MTIASNCTIASPDTHSQGGVRATKEGSSQDLKSSKKKSQKKAQGMLHRIENIG